MVSHLLSSSLLVASALFATVQAQNSSAAATTSSATTYACNPAHSYPGGYTCIATGGSLTLVAPTSEGSGSASSTPPVSEFTDGQPQVTGTAPAVSEFTDGQPQATATAPGVSEFSDGQPQVTATAPAPTIAVGAAALHGPAMLAVVAGMGLALL